MAKKKRSKPVETAHHDKKTILIALLAATLEGFADAAGGAAFGHHQHQEAPLPSEQTTQTAPEVSPLGIDDLYGPKSPGPMENPPAAPPPDSMYSTFSVSIFGTNAHLTERVRMPYYEPTGWLRDAEPADPASSSAVKFDLTLSKAAKFVTFIDKVQLLDKLTAAGDLTPKQRHLIGDVLEVKIEPAPAAASDK